MAEYGIRVYNNNNRLQLDGQYKNYYLKAKGAGVTPSSPYSWTQTSVSLPCTAAALIAIKCSGQFCVWRSEYSGGVKTFIIRMVTAGAFSWWLYDIDTPPAGIGYGINVFNADAECVFSSEHPPMRVIGGWAGRSQIDEGVGYSVNIDLGSPGAVDIAVVSGQHAWVLYQDEDRVAWLLVDFCKVDSTINRVVLSGAIDNVASVGRDPFYYDRLYSNYTFINVKNQ